MYYLWCACRVEDMGFDLFLRGSNVDYIVAYKHIYGYITNYQSTN